MCSLLLHICSTKHFPIINLYRWVSKNVENGWQLILMYLKTIESLSKSFVWICVRPFLLQLLFALWTKYPEIMTHSNKIMLPYISIPFDFGFRFLAEIVKGWRVTQKKREKSHETEVNYAKCFSLSMHLTEVELANPTMTKASQNGTSGQQSE